MTTVLAALDTGAAARAVLETAVRTAELTGAEPVAVHVARGPLHASVESDGLAGLAAGLGVPLRILEGPIEPSIAQAAGEPEVLALVIGARSLSTGGRPFGRTAGGILERVDAPVVVTPPEAVTPPAFRRLLLPLEGSGPSSRPVLDRLCPLLAADVELIVLHVFTDETLPAMLDRPGRDLEMLRTEFTARHFPGATRVELRSGPVADRVVEVAGRHEADLVVLSWSRAPEPGRGHVVRDVVADSPVPVLLLPPSAAAHRAGDPSGARRWHNVSGTAATTDGAGPAGRAKGR